MKVWMMVLACLILAGSVSSQDAAILRKKQFNLEKGIGISGYDPVEYFTQGKPVKDNKNFALVDEGITYYFSSSANKDEFKNNPSKFEPQYGGWCAYAMGTEGTKVEVDPETFKIIDGKLYLFYNKYFNNTLKSWNKNESVLQSKADANWQKIFH